MLWRTTASQLPVLEASLRRYRQLGEDSIDSRRLEREAHRLLGLISTLREELGKRPGLTCQEAVGPFVEVLKSSLVGPNTKACAVEGLERIVTAMQPNDSGAVLAVSVVCEAILECRFEHVGEEQGEEVAKIWILQGLAACCRFTNTGLGLLLSEEMLFKVVETLFDASTASFNSETVRSVALRILSQFIRELFSVAAMFFGSPDLQLALTTRRTFLFLVEMADPEHVGSVAHHPLPHNPGAVSWTRFVSLRLLVEASLASVNVDTARVGLIDDPQLLEIVKNDLMRTLVQTAQRAGNANQTLVTSTDPYRLFVLSEALRLANILLGNAECRKLLRAQLESFFNAVYCRVLERAVSPKHRTDEAMLVLESLCDLLQANGTLAEGNLLLDVFCSLDLSLQSTDVFENVFKLLSRLAHPTQLSVPALDPFRLLSLRGLLAALRSLSIETGMNVNIVEENYAKELKERKLALNRCAKAFSIKPSKGIQALVTEGILLPHPNMDALVLASFLRNTPSLDKVAIGQYLGEEPEFNRQVLRCFTETFDVRNRTLVDSLRSFLEGFRLPKEAQQIDRIIQAFADVAYSQCIDAEHFPTVDSCYLLCFAIIMLNTDLHNPNIRPERKMTIQQFSQNNRNYGEEISHKRDFPGHFLRQIFDAIAKREINTLKDGSSVTAEVSSDKWWDMLSRSRNPSSIAIEGIGSGYKRYMFELVWKHALVAIKVVFASGQTAEQPEALHQALDGFLMLAKCAAAFEWNGAFDVVMADLCMFTSLLVYNNNQPFPPLLAVDSVIATVGDTWRGQSGDKFGTEFGHNHKGQMAAMSVFALTRKFGSHLRKGWRHVLWCVLRLADLGLLPLQQHSGQSEVLLDAKAFGDFHVEMRQFVLTKHDADMQTKRQLTSVGNGSSVGEDQSWASWLLGMGSLSAEEEERNRQAWLEMDEDHRACMSGLRMADALLGPITPVPTVVAAIAADEFEMQYALDCVKSCRPLQILRDSANLTDESINALVDALLQALDMAEQETTETTRTTAETMDDLDIDLLSPPSPGSKLVAVHFLAELCLHNTSRFYGVFTKRVGPELARLVHKEQTSSGFLLELACVALLRITHAGLFIAPEVCFEYFELLANDKCLEACPGLDLLMGKVLLDLVSKPEFWQQEHRDGQPPGPIITWDSLLALFAKVKRSPNVLDALQVCAMFAAVEDRDQLVAFAVRELWDGGNNQVAMRVVDFCASLEGDVFAMQELALLAQQPGQSSESRRYALGALLRLVCSQDSFTPEQFVNTVHATCHHLLQSAWDGKVCLCAVELLVKGFLHHSQRLIQSNSFTELWVDLLQLLEQFKSAASKEGRDNEVEETCTELLKNLLLAMSSEGLLNKQKSYFVVTGQALVEEGEASDGESANAEALWEVTWAVLDRSPALLRDLNELPGVAIDLREEEEHQ
ncbi:hypothetical protein BASA81_007381 [Batrachochytrium salamandrivorans]|nr:hypothetical protein BASA81_007381 [Batrachochytrium salamandrivorans]